MDDLLDSSNIHTYIYKYNIGWGYDWTVSFIAKSS